MLDTLVIRSACDTDLELLSCLAIHTYISAFGHTFSEADLAHHLQTHLSPDCFACILDQDVVLIAEVEGRLVGYVQFGTADVTSRPLTLHDEDQELRRLYVHPEFQNRRIGTALMDAALRHPRLKNAANIFLEVWEYNQRAQRFYKRYGFEVIGTRIFTVASGSPTDLDLVMVRRSPQKSDDLMV